MRDLLPTLPLLEVERVEVRRGPHLLLPEVSLSVARGTVHALTGPNGAGKSTLLAAILGLTEFRGRIAAHWQAGGGIGYVPQSFHVDPTLPMTVHEFLGASRQRRPICFGLGAAARARVDGLLDAVGLPGFGARSLAALSGGELQRVLLANAADPRPELLVLDEAASGLDRAAEEAMERRIRAIRDAGGTVLMVSHDEEQTGRLADHVSLLGPPA